MSSDGFRERKRDAGTETEATEREAEDGPLHPRGPARQWRLLDIVTGAIIASVAIVFILIFTPMGDSTAAAGRRALAQMTSDPQNREKVLRWVQEKGLPLEPCDLELSDYIPCHDPKRAAKITRERNAYRERHCPAPREKLACLIPPPVGYQTPIQWPSSLHEVWKSNIPYTKISERKGHQGWMREEGDKFVFPGGGTMFPEAGGAVKYIQRLSKWIPLDTGYIRTALDMGCGVASFGAYLLRKDVLTMSFAPRDSHKAQIQFALERGIPAFVAMLGTQRLPFPSRAFDLVHCSRCLIPFTAFNGTYLLEMDRLLRPGGYFVISGPPVRWNEMETEWDDLQALARGMCYQRIVVEDTTAIFQKARNHTCYAGRGKPYPPRCNKSNDPNAAWYVSLSPCVTWLPDYDDDGWAGGQMRPWPLRLQEPPQRLLEPSIQTGLASSSRRSDLAFGNRDVSSSPGTVADFKADTRRWKRHLDRYEEILGGKFEEIGIRNILDMNAGYGGFAAGLVPQQVWVMNVVPVGTDTLLNTLPVIYDRGLIGLYHDWCEAFSSYPRTYDLIHVVNIRIFTTEMKRCTLVEVLLEMDRILRPDGTVIFRDGPKMLDNIARLAKAIRWDTQIFDPESSSAGNKRLLVAKKQFWTA